MKITLVFIILLLVYILSAYMGMAEEIRTCEEPHLASKSISHNISIFEVTTGHNICCFTPVGVHYHPAEEQVCREFENHHQSDLLEGFLQKYHELKIKDVIDLNQLKQNISDCLAEFIGSINMITSHLLSLALMVDSILNISLLSYNIIRILNNLPEQVEMDDIVIYKYLIRLCL